MMFADYHMTCVAKINNPALQLHRTFFVINLFVSLSSPIKDTKISLSYQQCYCSSGVHGGCRGSIIISQNINIVKIVISEGQSQLPAILGSL